MLAYFSAATGIKVAYSSSENYEQQIVIDTQAGSPRHRHPAAARPHRRSGLQGLLTDLGADTATWLKDNYAAGDSWVKLGTYKGKDGTEALYAFPYKIDVKSLVWYVPENFEDAGYEVPQTMEELKALTEQIVADGGTPWCIGLGSGGATGWPATDWVEDMMLRTARPRPMTSGSRTRSRSTIPPLSRHRRIRLVRPQRQVCRWRRSGGCHHRLPRQPQGSLRLAAQVLPAPPGVVHPVLLPGRHELGKDADFFYMPAYAGKDLGKPVLGAGTLAMITKDSEAARAFIEWLKTPIAHEVWMAQSGFLTPFKGANPEAYANDALKKQGEILLNATTFRFDGSDLMPGKIGAGAFWTGMVDYAGGKSAADVAAASRPSGTRSSNAVRDFDLTGGGVRPRSFGGEDHGSAVDGTIHHCHRHLRRRPVVLGRKLVPRQASSGPRA
jgi:alpha-glucoside transport system substrate-binding protein